jgi:hypothetical protein
MGFLIIIIVLVVLWAHKSGRPMKLVLTQEEATHISDGHEMKTDLKTSAAGAMRMIILSASVLMTIMLTSCDDENNASLLGGGPGSSDPNNTVAGDGFCGPQGGSQALGPASFDSGVTTAKIDTDGNPLMQGHDATWQADTSGYVNGQAVNSAKYAYVVMSPSQMAAGHVHLGDWATVTNTETGRQTYARVEDRGPEGGSGEISQATASAVGIQYASNSFTIGNPKVDVVAYGGTASIQGDCPPQVALQ